MIIEKVLHLSNCLEPSIMLLVMMNNSVTKKKVIFVKYVAKIYFLIFSLSMVFQLQYGFYYLIKVDAGMFIVVYIISFFVVAGLWHSWFKQRKNIYNLMIKINLLLKQKQDHNICVRRKIILALLVIFVFELMYPVVHISLSLMSDSFSSIYELQVSSNSIAMFLFYLKHFTYSNVLHLIPLFITLSMIILLHNITKLMLDYRQLIVETQLRKNLNECNSEEIENMLRQFFRHKKLAESLKNVFFISIFFFILFYFNSLFMLMAQVFVGRKKLSDAVIFNRAINLIFHSSMLLSLVYFASKIPETMKNVKDTIQCFFLEHQYLSLYNPSVKFLLERVDKTNEVYISAGGILNIERNFTITAAGSLLTYGLLILNLSE